MRVLMVTSSYPLFEGDVTAPFIESIARGLAARGHLIDLVLPEHPRLRRADEPGLRFFPFRYAPTPSLALWGYAQSLVKDTRFRFEMALVAPLAALGLRREVARRLRSEPGYDVAHLHWVIPNAALVCGMLSKARVPQVISLHGSDLFVAEKSRPLAALARRAFSRARAVTACSGDLRRRAVALGSPQERTRTVPYGVDASRFRPRPVDTALRERLGVRPGELLLLAFGRLVEKKGFRFLIEGVAKISGYALVIAGAGDLKGELEARAAELGVRASFPGALDRDAMAAALAAADVIAVPSVVDSAGNLDGLPNALLESLAAGRPVVASRVAGIPDVMQHESNGLLVPPGDSEALAQALSRLAAEPELRARLAGQARRRASTELTWGAAVTAFEECYARASALDAR